MLLRWHAQLRSLCLTTGSDPTTQRYAPPPSAAAAPHFLGLHLPRGPPFPVVLTDWLSMIAALGVGGDMDSRLRGHDGRDNRTRRAADSPSPHGGEGAGGWAWLLPRRKTKGLVPVSWHQPRDAASVRYPSLACNTSAVGWSVFRLTITSARRLASAAADSPETSPLQTFAKIGFHARYIGYQNSCAWLP